MTLLELLKYADRGAFEKYCSIADRYEANPENEELKAEYEKVCKDADLIREIYLKVKERNA